MSIGYAKLCSSVQDHNQSLIHRSSDWTSQRAKEFILKLKASEENASEENAPEEKCSWRWRHQKLSASERKRAPEATSSEARSSEATSPET